MKQYYDRKKIKSLIEGAYAQTPTMPGFWLKYDEFRDCFNELVKNRKNDRYPPIRNGDIHPLLPTPSLQALQPLPQPAKYRIFAPVNNCKKECSCYE